MFATPLICPATCELCGQWMPGHSSNCPRSGVHPSQWTMTYSVDPMNLQEYSVDNDDYEESSSVNWSHVNSLPAIKHEQEE